MATLILDSRVGRTQALHHRHRTSRPTRLVQEVMLLSQVDIIPQVSIILDPVPGLASTDPLLNNTGITNKLPATVNSTPGRVLDLVSTDLVRPNTVTTSKVQATEAMALKLLDIISTHLHPAKRLRVVNNTVSKEVTAIVNTINNSHMVKALILLLNTRVNTVRALTDNSLAIKPTRLVDSSSSKVDTEAIRGTSRIRTSSRLIQGGDPQSWSRVLGRRVDTGYDLEERCRHLKAYVCKFR